MKNLSSDTLIKLDNLLDDWFLINEGIIADKFFGYEKFKETFISTYNTLKCLPQQILIEKEYLELLHVLCTFESSRWFIEISEEHSAACHLVEQFIGDFFMLVYQQNETPTITDQDRNEYYYDEVDTIIALIKNDQ